MKGLYFKILETEDTLDLMESLIGTVATFNGTKEEYKKQYSKNKIKLNTLDGELIFKRSEIKLIK